MYQGQQLIRLFIIGGALADLDKHKVIDWKKFSALVGENRASHIRMTYLSFLSQEEMENIPKEELNELDIALMDKDDDKQLKLDI